MRNHVYVEHITCSTARMHPFSSSSRRKKKLQVETNTFRKQFVLLNESIYFKEINKFSFYVFGYICYLYLQYGLAV